MQSINKQLKRAIGLSVLGKYTAYAFQVLLLIIYARLFTPEQFGVLASLQVFVVFFMMLAEIGIGPALINIKEISNKDRDGLFSLTCIIGFFIAVTFYASTFLLNVFYHRNDYNIIGIPICISIIFYSCATIPTAFLQRERKFLTIAKSDVLSEVPTLFLVYFFCKQNQALMALAMRPFCVGLFRLILTYLFCRNTQFGAPKFGRNLYAIKPLLKFSSYQFGFNFINYFSRNLDNILVGKYMGLYQLGLYDKAYTLMKYPLQLLTFAMTPAIQPVLSKHTDDIELIESVHGRFTYYLSLLGVWAGFLMYINCDSIVNVILGNNWNQVAPILKNLSVIIPVQIILSTSGGFYQSMNRTNLLFRCGLFSAVTNVIAIVIGVIYGNTQALTICLIISFHLNFVQCYYVMYRYSFKKPITIFFRGIISSIILFVLLYYIWVILVTRYEIYIMLNDYFHISLSFVAVTSISIIYFVISTYIWNFFKKNIMVSMP